jgi:hypothetical protein
MQTTIYLRSTEQNPTADALPRDRRRRPPQPDDDSPAPPAEPEGPDEPDEIDVPCTDDDDPRWDVFIADDDDCDPLPDLGDFWIEDPVDE